ncbi:MAG: YicC family protein [Gammaproteobacteria bacterium]|nr:YicC family protein [Gammaproteobacteria bacterium]
MIRSMTAFARVQESNDAGSITWELRSVNHRYLEPGIKLPDEFRQLEPEIRKLLGRYLARGKVDLSLRYKVDQQQQSKIGLNADILRSLREVEQQVLNIVHEGSKLSVSDILGWPGVISESERDFTSLHRLAMSCLGAALQELQQSREAEGGSLKEMIRSRCGQVSDIVAEVRKHRPELMAALREKWESSLDEKLQQWRESANENRLEQELVMLAQKLDVEEELDRLDTHIAEVLNVLDRDEAVGRRLDFLMQELNREANTLGSKSQDGATTQQTVDLKVLIEQMREQVQNIE